MEYKITKDELGNDLLYLTLKALKAVFNQYELDVFVVGARARDIVMNIMKEKKPSRETFDLDVAVLLKDWDKFDNICISLQENNFKRIGKTQKFYYKGENGDLDFEIDLVPYGGIAEDEKIKWPPDGNPEMSVRCFEDVMAHSIDIKVDDDISFKIAPICGQFIIKLDTWNDRHSRTNKDAEDMTIFIKSYWSIHQNDLDFENLEELDLDDQDDTIIMGVKLLAYDVSKLLSLNHLRFFANLLKEEIDKEEQSILLIHIIEYWGSIFDDDNIKYDKCTEVLQTMHNVFENQIKKREA